MKKSSKSKFVLRTMVIMICIFISLIFAYQNIITTLQDNRNITISSFKEEQFKIIWKYLEGLQKQSKIKVTDISKHIETDILELSDDEFKQIQADMTNGIHNETLHDILMKYTENVNLNGIDDHYNGIVVMCNNGYMEDYNYRRAKIEGDNSIFRKWEDDINRSYNPELEEDAIDKILNRTSGIIALESYDLIKDEDHIKIKELTYDSLFKVYSKEGLSGLRNYQIFVPYYITDIGDIFGVPDISQGVKVKNNKIIVAQEFNLYDQLVNNKYDEIFNNAQIKNIVYRYDNILRWLYVFAVLIAFVIIILMIWVCSYYNMILDEECKCECHNHNQNSDNEESIKK